MKQFISFIYSTYLIIETMESLAVIGATVGAISLLSNALMAFLIICRRKWSRLVPCANFPDILEEQFSTMCQLSRYFREAGQYHVPTFQIFQRSRLVPCASFPVILEEQASTMCQLPSFLDIVGKQVSTMCQYFRHGKHCNKTVLHV